MLVYRFSFDFLSAVKEVFLQEAGDTAQFAFGMFSTVIAGVLSYPLDTIKMRILMEIGEKKPKYEEI